MMSLSCVNGLVSLEYLSRNFELPEIKLCQTPVLSAVLNESLSDREDKSSSLC